MSLMKIEVVKAKAFIELDPEKDIPSDEAFAEIVRLGLKEYINRGMSKLGAAKGLEGEALEKYKAAALEIANSHVEELKSGNIKMTGKRAGPKVSGEVNTEAMRIARNIIKDAIKANGGKISHYKASVISDAAKQYLAGPNGEATLKMAAENIAKRKVTPEGIDLSALVTGMKADPELVKAAEARKGKGKAAKEGQLSAKQAGVVAKAKGGKPAQATAH